MNFLALAQKRVSVRGYEDKPVPDALLERVLEAARLAPSATNRQPIHLIVVRDPAQRGALGEAYSKEWFAAAPIIVVVCTEPEGAWKRADGKCFADVDGAIVMDHITLCAADLGLGTCWIGAFNPDIVRRVLALPPQVEPLVLTPLGFPADAGRPKKRKALTEILHAEKW